MINQTPLDTTPNTPLDAIKAACLRGHDRISSATDSLVGSHEISEDSDAIGLLDEADYTLAVLVCEALGYDKPPRDWAPTRQSAPSLFTYDDGSPIYYGTTVAPGVSFVIWPRFDSRETLEAIFGYSIELAYREPPRHCRPDHVHPDQPGRHRVTHHLAVSSTLSAAAREALADFLSASCEVATIVDPDKGWPAGAATSIAHELVDAGYGTVKDGTFTLDIRPIAPQQLPTDSLDELVPALLLLDHIVERTDRQRSPKLPNPENVLGVSFGVLLQLQNVLRLAVYGQQGRLQHADVNRQLPAVATMLARAIRAEVVV